MDIAKFITDKNKCRTPSAHRPAPMDSATASGGQHRGQIAWKQRIVSLDRLHSASAEASRARGSTPAAQEGRGTRPRTRPDRPRDQSAQASRPTSVTVIERADGTVVPTDKDTIARFASSDVRLVEPQSDPTTPRQPAHRPKAATSHNDKDQRGKSKPDSKGTGGSRCDSAGSKTPMDRTP